MATEPHHRSDSSDTASSTSSAFQLILDHVLTYPGSYEIPLRTMYQINCAQTAQLLPGRSTTPSSTGSSPNLAQSAFAEKMTAQSFSENLLAKVAQLPNQPTSLPPSFITSFVQKIFPPELVLVDFPQALTGLDYLKDLETRRRREVAAAMSRLDIDRHALDAHLDEGAAQTPGLVAWVRSIEEKERKIESLYTQLYIGLRRWILVNEMSLLPFNKHNCVAMLNTLYPPVVTTQPTSKLTPSILRVQRDGFFNYIRTVERQGPGVLANLMTQGKGPTEENGWMAVTRIAGMYLQLANSVIAECIVILTPSDLAPPTSPIERDSRSVRSMRKADSGVSFKSFERPSSANGSDTVDSVEASRPRTAASIRPSAPTALEKLARGLKIIGRSRTNVTEMVPGPPLPPSSPQPPTTDARGTAKSLRKMRSMGTLDVRAGRRSPGPAVAVAAIDEGSAFNTDRIRRQRMKYEQAEQKFGQHRPQDV